MEMALNMGAFAALDQNELYAVDGGRPAEEYIAIAGYVCGVAVGAAVGFFVGRSVGAYVGGKWGGAVGTIVGTAVGCVATKAIDDIFGQI